MRKNALEQFGCQSSITACILFLFLFPPILSWTDFQNQNPSKSDPQYSESVVLVCGFLAGPSPSTQDGLSGCVAGSAAHRFFLLWTGVKAKGHWRRRQNLS